jgi:hypothetical protein
LADSDPVYKLIGPVLMKVDLNESRENVDKRLQFIEGEITKLDNQIAEKQGAQTTLGEEVTPSLPRHPLLHPSLSLSFSPSLSVCVSLAVSLP